VQVVTGFLGKGVQTGAITTLKHRLLLLLLLPVT
jgi:hypothetical protein